LSKRSSATTKLTGVNEVCVNSKVRTVVVPLKLLLPDQPPNLKTPVVRPLASKAVTSDCAALPITLTELESTVASAGFQRKSSKKVEYPFTPGATLGLMPMVTDTLDPEVLVLMSFGVMVSILSEGFSDLSPLLSASKRKTKGASN
jgi:hypothetical protein